MTSPSAALDRSHSPLSRLGWLWLSLGWGVVGGLFALQTVWLGGFSWDAALAWAVLDWGVWIPLAPLALWLAGRIAVTSRNWRRTVPAHLALSLLFAATVELASVAAWQLGWMPDPRPRSRGAGAEFVRMPPPDRPEVRPGEDRRPPRPPGPGGGDLRSTGAVPPGLVRRPVPVGTGRGRLALPIYFLLIAGAHALSYHRASLERERRALAAEARLAEARALALQTQLQPHFFFNALNTVASLIYTQPELAEETICSLGELMRGVLDAADRRELALREELAFVERYLAVQQIRFGPRLRVVHDVPAEVQAAAVPTLLLQPLVENAVVHGVAPFPAAGTVTLSARRAGERLRLSVSNRSEGAEPAPAGPLQFTPRVGIANTRSRLAALYGPDFRCEFARAADGTITATVEIPWKVLPA